MSEFTSPFLKHAYFPSYHFCHPGKANSPFEIEMDDSNKASPEELNIAFNLAVLSKLESLAYVQREPFLAFQIGLYDSPEVFLIGVKGLLEDVARGNQYFLNPAAYSHFSEIINQKIQQLNQSDSAINENSSPKLIWNHSPHLFFQLFSCFYELGYIKANEGSGSVSDMAQELFEHFEVRSSRGKKEPYARETFIQNMKTSSSMQTGTWDKGKIRKEIETFLFKLIRE